MKLNKELKSATRKKNTTHTASAITKGSTNGQSAAVGKTGSSKSVTIQAKIDVGFGNTLYMRGEGRGLSWNRGVPLTCVNRSTWQWTGAQPTNVPMYGGYPPPVPNDLSTP